MSKGYVTTEGNVTTTVRTRVQHSEGYYAIRQTSLISDMVASSGHFATVEAALDALTDDERANLGGTVRIVWHDYTTITTSVSTDTLIDL